MTSPCLRRMSIALTAGGARGSWGRSHRTITLVPARYAINTDPGKASLGEGSQEGEAAAICHVVLPTHGTRVARTRASPSRNMDLGYRAAQAARRVRLDLQTPAPH